MLLAHAAQPGARPGPALIAGAIRGLPLGWQLIDIAIGVIAAAVGLTIALVLTCQLERSCVIAR